MDPAVLALFWLLAPGPIELLALKTQEAKAPAWTFTDVAPECGIDFKHRFGRDSFQCILDDTGSGVALLDYDGDGLLDVYLINGGWLEGVHPPPGEGHRGATNRLYRNLGGMKFRDVTAEAKVGHTGYGMGAAVGDYDGDGDEDLYVLNYGPNVLYGNDGKGSFTDVTAEAGLAGPPMLSGGVKWSVNGVFFDADCDSDLDLFVANYLAFDPESPGSSAPGEPYPGPESYRAQRSIFYRNDAGKFADVTGAVGLMAEEVKSMGASVADFNDDGLPDLFEAGDTVPNALFRRENGGRWHEVGIASGAALDRLGQAMSSMHGTIGDYDGDGRLDLFVPNLAHGCLYKNAGDFQFKESSGSSGVAPLLKDLAGWGSQFSDFDHDGDLDLLVVTGGTFDIQDAQPLKMLRNDGSGNFTDISKELGPDFGSMVGRGAAFGDLDGDGDVDLVVNRKDQGGLASVFRNDLPAGRHWLIVNPVGTKSNREGIGARVTLQVGGKRQIREVQRSNSYLSQDDRRVHFGLGDAQKVDSLVVRWPCGKEQTVDVQGAGGIDRVLTVLEPGD